MKFSFLFRSAKVRRNVKIFSHIYRAYIIIGSSTINLKLLFLIKIESVCLKETNQLLLLGVCSNFRLKNSWKFMVITFCFILIGNKLRIFGVNISSLYHNQKSLYSFPLSNPYEKTGSSMRSRPYT